MKKKIFAALAATLVGATFAFSGCTSGESKIVFGNYWNYNTEPTSHETIDETLEYEVSFTQTDSAFINYELDYDGTYVTRLLSQSGGTYLFTSQLTVDVTFTVNGKSETKQDSVTTEVIFYEAGGTDNLRPVSSKKTIVSHTPASNNEAAQPKDCYQRYDYVFTTTYADGIGVCKSVSRIFNEETQSYDRALDYVQEFTFGASSGKRSVLDNEQFSVAFRALPAGTNTKVQMFNPFLGYSQTYALSLTGDAKEKSYKYELNGVLEDRTIAYRTASISVDGTSSGQPQWAEIAALQDAKTNANRNVMLYYSAPLAYNMGVLQYKLVKATYVK